MATCVMLQTGLLTQLRRVWVQHGVKPVCRIQMVREWGYLALAVDGPRGQLYWTWQTNMKKESCAQTMQAWLKEGVATVIWDGVGGHRAALTRAVEVKQIIQPAYSPELNPAERVFEEVRRSIEGRVYDSVAAKQAAVDELLITMNSDPAGVRRLAGWEWITANRQPVQEYAALPAGNGISSEQYALCLLNPLAKGVECGIYNRRHTRFNTKCNTMHSMVGVINLTNVPPLRPILHPHNPVDNEVGSTITAPDFNRIVCSRGCKQDPSANLLPHRHIIRTIPANHCLVLLVFAHRK
jgi:transposase